MGDIMDWFFYYIIYAFLGYICEVVYVSVLRRKLTNRGYLYGPICPIYGYGAILVIACLKPLYDANLWYLVLILGFLLTTALEYLTSVALEYLFHMRWWDYSSRKFNIKGRVCLLNSTLFCLLVMAVMYLIHPQVLKLLGLITNQTTRVILFYVLLATTIIDTFFSTLRHLRATKIIDKIKAVLAKKPNASTKRIGEYLNNNKIVNLFKKYTSNYEMLIKANKGKGRIKLKEYLSTFKDQDEKTLEEKDKD